MTPDKIGAILYLDHIYFDKPIRIGKPVMKKKILVTYATNCGSTVEVAESVAAELAKAGFRVDCIPMAEVSDIASYSGVVAGAPMILGWHRNAVRFLKKHQEALSRVPTACFFTAVSLTQPEKDHLDGVPLYLDPSLVKKPQDFHRLSRRERYALVENYLGKVLKRVPKLRPASAAFFAGKVDYSRMKPLQMLFVMLIIGAQPGDRRNWTAIRDWSTGLEPIFSNGKE
jgi:menaquinone-dependent protoporphyrinogen oxidase